MKFSRRLCKPRTARRFRAASSRRFCWRGWQSSAKAQPCALILRCWKTILESRHKSRSCRLNQPVSNREGCCRLMRALAIYIGSLWTEGCDDLASTWMTGVRRVSRLSLDNHYAPPIPADIISPFSHRAADENAHVGGHFACWRRTVSRKCHEHRATNVSGTLRRERCYDSGEAFE